MDPDSLLLALHWAWERHRIWKRRQAGDPYPWTRDRVLATRKFTNLFRVLDPGSQFPLVHLYRDVEPVEVLARAWLYRHTNLPDPWEYLAGANGGYPYLSSPGGSETVHEAFTDVRNHGTGRWSSGAYILRPESVGGKHVVGGDKLEFFTRRCRELFVDDRYDTVTDFFRTESAEERHAILMRPEGVGPFMAMQILTDFHYTLDEDREDEFVAPGPGSTRGAAFVWPGQDPVKVFRAIQSALHADPACPTIGSGRKPSLMDVQNLCCELSKYVKGPVSTAYNPAHPGPQPKPTLPSYYR